MPLAALGLILLIGFALVVLSVPLAIVQRYRLGKARRLARGWVAAVNLFGIATSALVLLMIAAVSSAWVPNAIPYSLGGLLAGCVLGLAGLAVTRWEATPRSLHYTPNRWLVLSITLIVLSRMLYGIWRGWHAWQSTPDGSSWLAEAGAAGSMAAAAIVIGYYLIYWVGLRRRIRRFQNATGGIAWRG